MTHQAASGGASMPGTGTIRTLGCPAPPLPVGTKASRNARDDVKAQHFVGAGAADVEVAVGAEGDAKARATTRALLPELPLHRLRAARHMTQEQLADTLHVRQAAISRLERRADVYLSTVRRYVATLGGVLEITAHFPDGTAVRVGRFGDLEDHR
jgi:DNA-binding XRE family transcriptional regulator